MGLYTSHITVYIIYKYRSKKYINFVYCYRSHCWIKWNGTVLTFSSTPTSPYCIMYLPCISWECVFYDKSSSFKHSRLGRHTSANFIRFKYQGLWNLLDWELQLMGFAYMNMYIMQCLLHSALALFTNRFNVFPYLNTHKTLRSQIHPQILLQLPWSIEVFSLNKNVFYANVLLHLFHHVVLMRNQGFYCRTSIIQWLYGNTWADGFQTDWDYPSEFPKLSLDVFFFF